MMRQLPVLALALIAMNLNGCADLEWARSGADAARVSSDLDACRGVALRNAGPPVVPSGSAAAVSDPGRPRAMQPTASSNERFVAEQEAISRCMVSRGYTLQPAH